MAIEAMTLALDGVIFDTEDMHLHACNTAFERCGLGLRWSLQQLREATRVRGAANAVSVLSDKLGVPAAGADMQRLQQEKNIVFHELVLTKGVVRNAACARLMEDALDNGCKLAVVADMPVRTATTMLEQAFGNAVNHLFSVVMCGADFQAPVGNGPYSLALRTMGVEPSDCAAIDAAVPGLNAARCAGMWTVAVTPYEGNIDHISGADVWCPQWQELHQLDNAGFAVRPAVMRHVGFDYLHTLKYGHLNALRMSPVAMQAQMVA